jgi:hypothetical protein
VLSAVVVGLTAGASVGTSVEAYGYDCNPHRNSDFPAAYLGGGETPGMFADVKAEIEERVPYVNQDMTGAFNNFSYSWVSLSDSSGDRYLQIGTAADNNDVRWVFEQYENSTGAHDVNWDPINPVGSTTTYKVSRDTSTTYGAWWGENEDVQSMSFTQAYASLASETTDQADQFNGTGMNHEGFQHAEVFDASSGNWESFGGTVQKRWSSRTQPTWIDVYKAADDHYETWDGSC